MSQQPNPVNKRGKTRVKPSTIYERRIEEQCRAILADPNISQAQAIKQIRALVEAGLRISEVGYE